MDRVEIGEHVLWLGDNRDVLPLIEPGTVQALVTDPPYGCSVVGSKDGRLGSNTSKAGIRGRNYRPIIGDDQSFDPVPWLGFNFVILWGGNWYGDKLPTSSRWLIWDKRDGTSPNNMADCEMAWTNLGGPARVFSHRWMGMIRTSEKKTTDRVHPAQKPVALMEWCLSFLPEKITVLDPFCGSGTTIVACARTGRRGIGIEKDRDYFRIAVERIEREVHEAKHNLFAAPEAEQATLEFNE